MFLQTAGVIVLGWIALSVLVAISWSIFMRRAREIDAEYPIDPGEVRAWVRDGAPEPPRQVRRGAVDGDSDRVVLISSRRRRRRRSNSSG